MNQGPTIADVIANVTKVAGLVAGFSALLSLGITQFIKDFTSNPKKIAIFAVIFGYVIGSLLMKVAGYNLFSSTTILVGLIAAFGAPGIFSVTKTLKNPTSPTN